MLELSKKRNYTQLFHPFLESYPQFQHLLEGQQEPFNNSDISFISTTTEGQYLIEHLININMSIISIVLTAMKSCKKPCVDVVYEPGKETFTVGSPEYTSRLAGCKAGEGGINLQFSQQWKYEQVM